MKKRVKFYPVRISGYATMTEFAIQREVSDQYQNHVFGFKKQIRSSLYYHINFIV